MDWAGIARTMGVHCNARAPCMGPADARAPCVGRAVSLSGSAEPLLGAPFERVVAGINGGAMGLQSQCGPLGALSSRNSSLVAPVPESPLRRLLGMPFLRMQGGVMRSSGVENAVAPAAGLGPTIDGVITAPLL